MTVYAVFREAVYRHECLGVFSTLEKAKGTADAEAAIESDDRHDIVIYPFELDVALIGTWKTPGEHARGSNPDFFSEPNAVYSTQGPKQPWNRRHLVRPGANVIYCGEGAWSFTTDPAAADCEACKAAYEVSKAKEPPG